MKTFSPLKTLFLGLTLALPLMGVLLPQESAQAGYKPPKRPAAASTIGGGTRSGPAKLAPPLSFKTPLPDNGTVRSMEVKGCMKNLTGPLTMFAPEKEVGQTLSGRPDVFFYLDGPAQISVKLAENGTNESQALWKRSATVSQPGVNMFAYPTDVPELEAGKTYALYVEMRCDIEGQDAHKVKTRIGIQRLASSSTIEKAIADAKTPQEKAAIYGNEGLWFDTLAAQALAVTESPDSGDAEFLKLLEQVNLKAIADKLR
ncbi:MAG: DUF928 domain-containing protein [Alkalinema sp. RU_4_3]|nr:DUF928 domain-containing protein [Alkalinema sp. RU_4_3]